MATVVAAYTFSYDWYVQFRYDVAEWRECDGATSSDHAVFRHVFADDLYLAGETSGTETVWRLSLDSIDDLSRVLPIVATIRVAAAPKCALPGS